MRKNFPSLISIDWLQYYCHQNENWADVLKKLTSYSIKDVGHGSKVFKRLWEVRQVGFLRPIAILALEPYSDVIDPRSVIMKIDNEILYTEDVFKRCEDLMNELHLTYRGITRIDLAYDCQYLYEGRTPTKLLKDYVNGKIVKKGHQSKFYINGTQNYKVSHAAEIENQLLPHTWTGCTWGVRSSGVQCQMYNKSLELREVKSKPWIIEAWKAAGLNKQKDVWRFEIRISDEGKDLKEMFGEQLFKLGRDQIRDKETIQNLFLAYANRYFDFAKVTHQPRRSRLKSIKLFNIDEASSLVCKHIIRKIAKTKYLTGIKNKLNKISDDLKKGNLESEYDHANLIMKAAKNIMESVIYDEKVKEQGKMSTQQIGEIADYVWRHHWQRKIELAEMRKYIGNDIQNIIKLENKLRQYDDE